MATFFHLRPGDKVKRLIGGLIAMPMIVTEVKDRTLLADAFADDGSIFHGQWEFDRETGAEEDPELGWGRAFGATGSFLVHD